MDNSWHSLLTSLVPKIEHNGHFVVTFMNASALKNHYGELYLTHMNKPMFCVRYVNKTHIEVFIATIGKWHQELLVDPFELSKEFHKHGLNLIELVPLEEFHNRVAPVKLSKQEVLIANLYYCAIFQKTGKKKRVTKLIFRRSSTKNCVWTIFKGCN